MTAVWRPEAQETWFTPVVRFPGLAGETVDAIEWTTSSKDPIPETEFEVVTKVGRRLPALHARLGEERARREPAGRLQRLQARRDDAARGAALPLAAHGRGPVVGMVGRSERAAVVAPEAQGGWLPASPRTKEAYEADIVGSQGQQYQRCRTWNLGIIDAAKRGWVITQQDENGCRLTKNGNAGADGDPVLWGFPRLDGYHGGKSGGLYLNTDDNAGDGLFVGVSGWLSSAGGFGTTRGGDRRLCRRRHAQLGEEGRHHPPVRPRPLRVRLLRSEESLHQRQRRRRSTTSATPSIARATSSPDGPQVPEMQQCTVFKTTKALLDADLAYAAGTKAASMPTAPRATGRSTPRPAPAARARGRRRSSF